MGRSREENERIAREALAQYIGEVTPAALEHHVALLEGGMSPRDLRAGISSGPQATGRREDPNYVNPYTGQALQEYEPPKKEPAWYDPGGWDWSWDPIGDIGDIATREWENITSGNLLESYIFNPVGATAQDFAQGVVRNVQPLQGTFAEDIARNMSWAAPLIALSGGIAGAAGTGGFTAGTAGTTGGGLVSSGSTLPGVFGTMSNWLGTAGNVLSAGAGSIGNMLNPLVSWIPGMGAGGTVSNALGALGTTASGLAGLGGNVLEWGFMGGQNPFVSSQGPAYDIVSGTMSGAPGMSEMIGGVTNPSFTIVPAGSAGGGLAGLAGGLLKGLGVTAGLGLIGSLFGGKESGGGEPSSSEPPVFEFGGHGGGGGGGGGWPGGFEGMYEDYWRDIMERLYPPYVRSGRSLAKETASDLDKETIRQWQKVFPQFQGMLGQRERVVSSQLRGELSDETRSMMEMVLGEQAVQGGFAGSGLARNLVARDLGRAVEDLQLQGLTASDQLMAGVNRDFISRMVNIPMTAQHYTDEMWSKMPSVAQLLSAQLQSQQIASNEALGYAQLAQQDAISQAQMEYTRWAFEQEMASAAAARDQQASMLPWQLAAAALPTGLNWLGNAIGLG